MRIEETIINVIFDAGRGSVPVASREMTVGKPYGVLPTPTRRGYVFSGWFLGDLRITGNLPVEADSDITLVARWEKRKESGAVRSMLRRQKAAIAALLVAILLLSGVLVGVNYIVSIYGVEDISYDAAGNEIVTKYYIRKKGGSYGLYNENGVLMETNSEGFYLAASGNQYEVDRDTGDYSLYARVDYEDTEVGTLKTRLLLFPQIKQENVYSIDVKNSHGGYRIYRTPTGAVELEGWEDSMISYDAEQYAMLCVSSGYPLSLAKLNLKSAEAPRKADGSIDYSAYGLETLYDENGEVTYTPAEVTITQADLAQKANGVIAPSATAYTLRVGSKITSESGFYVQVVGRDAIYVLNADLEKTVLQPIEMMVEPAAISPLTLTSFTETYNFVISTLNLHGFEWKDGMTEEDVMKDLDRRVIEQIVAFSFQSLPERSNTIFSATPYISEKDLMEGYLVNGNNVSDALGCLYEMTILECKKLGITPEALEEFGLTEKVFCLNYISPLTLTDSETNKEVTNYIQNTLLISQKTENDTYYVASLIYDMIVEVEAKHFRFLTWDAADWYSDYPIQTDINYMKEWSMTIDGKTYDFILDNRLSYSYYYVDGEPKLADTKDGSIVYNSATNSFQFRDRGGVEYSLYYVNFESGDFYINANSEIIYRLSSGKELTMTLNSNYLMVYCKQYSGKTPFSSMLVDYVIRNTEVNDKGENETTVITALDNFRQLYKTMYFTSIEDVVDDAEFAKYKGMTVEEFIRTNGEKYDAILRYKYEDMASVMNQYYKKNEDGTSEKLYTENNAGEVVLRFYNYSGSRMLMTMEIVTEYDADGNPVLDATRAVGNFYVLKSSIERLQKNADAFLGKQPVIFKS